MASLSAELAAITPTLRVVTAWALVSVPLAWGRLSNAVEIARALQLIRFRFESSLAEGVKFRCISVAAGNDPRRTASRSEAERF
jgi:hypothetical protein